MQNRSCQVEQRTQAGPVALVKSHRRLRRELLSIGGRSTPLHRFPGVIDRLANSFGRGGAPKALHKLRSNGYVQNRSDRWKGAQALGLKPLISAY
jgi:hypothetical protein